MTLTFGKKLLPEGLNFLYKLLIQSVGLCWCSSQIWRRTAVVPPLAVNLTNRSPICKHDLDFHEVYHQY